MTTGTCSKCGAELDGRFCGDCGSDNGEPIDGVLTEDRQHEVTDTSVAMEATVTTPARTSVDSFHPSADRFPDIGELYESAWSRVQSNVGDWVLTVVVSAGLLGILGVLYIAYQWISTDTEKVGAVSFSIQKPIPVLEFTLWVLTVLVGAAIRFGFARTALMSSRGERAVVNDVWSPARFVPFVIVDIVIGGLMVVGFVIPIAGSLLMLALTLYAPFLVIDGNGSGITAVFRSFRITSRGSVFWSQALFSFIGLLIILVPAALSLWFVFSGLGSADFFEWDSKWRNLVSLVVAVMFLALTALAAAVSMTAAATAYGLLRSARNDD